MEPWGLTKEMTINNKSEQFRDGSSPVIQKKISSTSVQKCHSRLKNKKLEETSLQRDLRVTRRTGDIGREYLERKVLCNKFFDSTEQEKKRISQDLHDGLGQILTNINLRINQGLQNMQELSDTPSRNSLEQVLGSIPALIGDAMDEVRNICKSIRPSELDDLGILKALQSKCRSFSRSVPAIEIRTTFALQEKDISEGLKTPIYRITQEALNNAIKHANAKNILVELEKRDGVLTLCVEDDGIGFEPEAHFIRQAQPGEAGFGLTSMRQRSEAFGGVLRIVSSNDSGTAVCVSWRSGHCT